MKSPEQIGGPPEQPKEESMSNEKKWEELKQGRGSERIYLKGKEIGVSQEILDQFAREVIARNLELENYPFVYGFRKITGISRSESAVPYDKEEWEKEKLKGVNKAAFVFAKGYEMGVPKRELNRFAESVIAEMVAKGQYDSVYLFRKNMSIGTAEEMRDAGKQAYKFFLESGDSGSAMSIAEDVYGRDSEEWKRANEANEAEWKKTEEKRKRKEKEMENEERELNVTISKDATFADLFNAIDAIEKEEGLGELYFEENLYDNFDSEIEKEILSFRNAQTSKVATIKVLDFFKERGYTQNDVAAYLPIKFKRERKKKW